ncbi:MAG: HIT family protein [Candidatus Nanoarchaeia archaeon]
MNDCIFCKIINNEMPAQKIYENDKVLAFLDIHPCNYGHTLVVPKNHYKDLLDTPKEIVAELMSAVQKIAPAVVKGSNAQGFNLGLNNGSAAGQIIFHAHFHIIPRFAGDGLIQWGHKEYAEGGMEKIKNEIIKHLR